MEYQLNITNRQADIAYKKLIKLSIEGKELATKIVQSNDITYKSRHIFQFIVTEFHDKKMKENNKPIENITELTSNIKDNNNFLITYKTKPKNY